MNSYKDIMNILKELPKEEKEIKEDNNNTPFVLLEQLAYIKGIYLESMWYNYDVK